MSVTSIPLAFAKLEPWLELEVTENQSTVPNKFTGNSQVRYG
jgi:hypothetical protein